ncbi:putative alpha-1,3-mannosyltransferase [Stachybotrys elegans]|uniref:Alpha-1,3-mannosyltransferase n=1 Tax=Stachybotrys elegans TaxID=80388 RepID=A0A8K0WWE1_9HYPO|nr:putative alpha-1,3-mannosyltransferase [Stachybotrys elegans]
MPPHLHPRSRMTSSLFATTVIASFFVVAMPHLLPCPVPATKYADGEIMVDENGKRKRWRRKQADESKDGIVQFTQATDEGSYASSERGRRECPVPKPGGMLGEWLGFHKAEADSTKRTDR